MQSEQGEIKVVIFSVIRNPVVQQQKKKDNSYPTNGGHHGFTQFEQPRLAVNVGILSGNVIDSYPESWDKKQCQVKFIIEFHRNLIAEFDRFNINLPVNIE